METTSQNAAQAPPNKKAKTKEEEEEDEIIRELVRLFREKSPTVMANKGGFFRLCNIFQQAVLKAMKSQDQSGNMICLQRKNLSSIVVSQVVKKRRCVSDFVRFIPVSVEWHRVRTTREGGPGDQSGRHVFLGHAAYCWPSVLH